MALMSFREPNQVLWRGVRPGHNGTQVLREAVQIGAGSATLWTVSAGVVGYLTQLVVSPYGNVGGNWTLEILDAVPARRYYLMLGSEVVGQGNRPAIVSYWPPIELPTGWSLRVSAAAGVTVYAFCHGWEE